MRQNYKTRPVEVGVCIQGAGNGGTWFTHIVDIPASTPEAGIEAAAVQAYQETEYAQSGEDIIAHVFVYHVPELEDDGDEDDDAGEPEENAEHDE